MDRKKLVATLQRLKKFKATHEQVNCLEHHLKRKLLNPRKKNSLCNLLNENEQDALLFLLAYATNVPFLYAEHLDLKRRVSEAEEILLRKGSDKQRGKLALEKLGTSITSAKQKQDIRIESSFQSIMKRDGSELPDGTYLLKHSINQKDYVLKWRTPTEKKREALRVVREHYEQASPESVDKKLRRRKGKI